MFNRNTVLGLALASSLMLAGVNAAFAHDHKACDMKSGELKKELKLTDDQAKKVEAIYADAKTKMEAIKTDTQTQVRAVLTDDQKKKYDEMMAKHSEKKADKDSKKTSGH